MRQNLFRIIGAAAACLLVLLLLLAWRREYGADQTAADRPKEEAKASFSFQSDELVYSGKGKLDLMDGVTATDSRGNDLTSQVNALLTGEGSGSRKKIRYSVFDEEGREVTGERTLVLKQYQGPKIEMDTSLELEAEDLEDLIGRLRERGEIKGLDGFGVDITDRITWRREKIAAWLYEITFSLDNDYLDHTQETVQARISGEVQDLTLNLWENRIEIPVGSEFYPWDYLESAQDPSFGSIAERVQIQSMVNTAVPGSYSVVYSVTSVDGTQTAEAVLQVTVTGGAG